MYVKVSCAGKSGKTGTEDDTFTPGFNDVVLTVTAQQLGAGVTIEVYDYDLIAPPDELIGGCNAAFSKAVLEQGSFTVQNCGGQDVQSVLFSFGLK